MLGDEARLRAILESAESDPRVHDECLRISRSLRHAGHHVVGLVPAGPDVAVPPLALQLGMTLVELARGTVALVDANLHWPALMPQHVDGRRKVDGESLFAGRWLRSLAILAPRRAGTVGEQLQQLARVLEKASDRCAHVLVDLTGYDRLGDLLGAVGLTGGVAIVARAGSTREGDIVRLRDELPPEKNLGVVLVHG